MLIPLPQISSLMKMTEGTRWRGVLYAVPNSLKGNTFFIVSCYMCNEDLSLFLRVLSNTLRQDGGECHVVPTFLHTKNCQQEG